MYVRNPLMHNMLSMCHSANESVPVWESKGSKMSSWSMQHNLACLLSRGNSGTAAHSNMLSYTGTPKCKQKMILSTLSHSVHGYGAPTACTQIMIAKLETFQLIWTIVAVLFKTSEWFALHHTYPCMKLWLRKSRWRHGNSSSPYWGRGAT